jgi:DNA-binding transcriptional ArsR family regulator
VLLPTGAARAATEADDHGHGPADARILKGALWALDDDVTHPHVSAHLAQLVATGHIRLYESGGDTYFEVVAWSKHQAAAYRRGEPKYPLPDGYIEDLSHVDVQKSASRTTLRAGREGKG